MALHAVHAVVPSMSRLVVPEPLTMKVAITGGLGFLGQVRRREIQ